MFKRTARRFFSLVLCLCMILGMTDWSALSVRAAGIDISNDSNLTIAMVNEPSGGYIYTGTAINPQVTIKYGSTDVSGLMTVTYPDTDAGDYVEPGSYVIRVTGDGTTYTGYQDFYFTIGKVPLSKVTAAPIADKDWTGSQITVDTTEYNLSYNGYTLVYGADYTFDRYYDRVGSSTGTVETAVQLKALGSSTRFTGTVQLPFNIVRRTLAGENITVESIGPLPYTGTAYGAADLDPEVKDGSTLLSKGSDYYLDFTNNAGPGLVQLKIVGSDYGSYKGTSKTVTFLIEKDLSHVDITAQLAAGADLTYTGNEVKPNVVVKDKTTTLTKDTHYTVSYVDNIEPGLLTTKAVITGVEGSGYTGTKEIYFEILPVNVDDAGNDLKIEVGSCVYNGKAQRPDIKVTYKDKEIDPSNYYPTYTNNKDAGTATVTVNFSGVMTGNKSQNFTIARKSLDDTDSEGSISVSLSNYNPSNPPIYTGTAITSVVPVVTYTNSDGETYTLDKDIDYTLAYSNNTNAGIAVIQITGKGNYRNSISENFTIGAKSILGATTEGIGNKAYTGVALTQSFTVKLGDVTLSTPRDYKVEYENNLNVGTATVKIIGQGNYAGEEIKTFEITKVSLTDGNISISTILPQTYNGSPITPGITLRYNNITLEEGKDYNLTYSNNTDATDSALVTISAVPDVPGRVCNFKDSTSKTFIINKLNIAEQNGRYVIWNGLTPSPPVIYTGQERELDELQIRYEKTGSNGTVTLDLVKNRDYVVSYSDNVEIGLATVTVTAADDGNYTGSVTENFKIYGNLGNTNNTIIKTVDGRDVFSVLETYTGNEIKLDLVVTCYGKVLTEGTDYRVVYSDNVNVGPANILIEAVEGGYYYDSQPTTFTIVQKDIGEEPYLNVSIPDQIYTGIGIIPPLTVSYNGHSLTEGDMGDITTDFYTEYLNNVDVGSEAKVILYGQGNFTGYKEEYFNILPRDISDNAGGTISIDNLEDIIYRGEDEVIQNESSLVVKYNNADAGFNDKVLTSNDFDITYENNTQVGEAKIVITGKGNYKGTAKRSFKIKGDLADIDIDSIADQIYSGLEKQPTPDITYTCGIMQDVLLEEGVDYELEYRENIQTSENGIIYSIPTVEITGINFYDGYRETTFTILPKNLSEDLDGIEFDGIVEDGYEYTRFPIEPDFTMKNHGNTMILSTDAGVTGDYLITGYDHNLNVPEEDSEDQPSIFIQGIGRNYTGDTILNFKIVPRKLTADTIEVVGESEDGSIIYNMDGSDKFDFVDRDTYMTYPVVKVYYIENKGLPTENKILLEEGEDKEYTIEYKDNNRIGKATLSVTGHGNYAETYDSYFKVTGSINNDDYTEIKPIPPQYYSGAIIGTQPSVELIVDGVELVENTDYTLAHDKNKAIASADDPDPDKWPTVTITAIGEYYSGERDVYYDIVKRDFDDKEKGMEGIEITGVNENGYEYTGSPITFSFQIFNHQEELILGEDYEFDFENNVNASDTDPCIVITGIGEKYKGTAKVSFKITRKTGFSIESIADQEFTGFEIEPVPVVTIGSGENKKTLVEGTDYTISYANNIDVASRTIGSLAPKVIVEGMGNYQGTTDRSFSITQKNISSNSDTDYFRITVKGSNTYNGGSVIPELEIIRVFNGKEIGLTVDKDYQLSAGTQSVNAGTANVRIRGIGNYTGEYLQDFTILPLDVAKVVDDGNGNEIPIITIDPIDSIQFDGTAKEPSVSVLYYNELTGTTTNLPAEVNGARNYRIEYKDNLNAGEAIVRLHGEGNFTGQKDINFTITPKSLEDSDIPAFEFSPEYAHLGTEVKPLPNNEVSYNGYVLTAGVDYIMVYTDNIKAGTAGYVIEGTGNFSGSLSGSFVIIGDLAKSDIETITLQQYTGSEVEPEVNVSFYGDALESGTHFTVQYENNTNIGKAKAIITAVEGSNYIGTKTIEFIISEDFSSEMSVVGIASNYIFTGSSIKPVPAVVSVYGEVLKNGTDYQLAYSNNVNTGTAVVTVSGVGKYKGDKAITYNIVPKSIARTSVSNVSNQVYSGKSFSPAPKVVDGNNTLVKDKDYTVVYVNNQKPGTSTVIINGKGNYSGSQNAYFNITLSQVSSVKFSATSTSKVKLTWKKQTGVTGYEIYDSKNKLVTKVKKNTNSCTISNVNSTKTYKYKIRSYVYKDGKITFGRFSTTISISSKPKTPTAALKSSKSKQATISWKKISGATGYEVYQSTSKNGKYSRVANTSKTSYTKTKLTSKKTYYYKVRAYKTIGNTKVYSAYSSIKSIRIK